MKSVYRWTGDNNGTNCKLIIDYKRPAQKFADYVYVIRIICTVKVMFRLQIDS